MKSKEEYENAHLKKNNSFLSKISHFRNFVRQNQTGNMNVGNEHAGLVDMLLFSDSIRSLLNTVENSVNILEQAI